MTNVDSDELSNCAYVQNANAFASSGGLGINTVVKSHLGITLLQADYLYSRLPNAESNRQNDCGSYLEYSFVLALAEGVHE